MAINKKLVHFGTFANFQKELSAGNILDTSIVFIKDTQQIYTHGQYYNCSLSLEELEQQFASKNDITDMLTKTEANNTYATKQEIPVSYTLPIATASVLGGIKVGAGLSINSETGVLSATGGGTADSVDWSNITSKPSSFTPSSHTHNISDISNLQNELNNKLESDDIQDMATQTWVKSQGYITSIPDNYITETKLSEYNYITSSQANILYATKDELNAKADSSDISDMLTKTEAKSLYQSKGSYLTSVPVATTTTLGGIKLNYQTSGNNYKVQVDSNNNAYVNVPWTDTTYQLVQGNGTTGLIKNGSSVTSSAGYTACPIISGVPYYKDTNTTYTLSSFGITATAAELNYCDGVTSNIQDQLNAKASSNQTMYLGNTQVSINRSSGQLTLDGVSINGSAGSVDWNNISGKPPIPEQYVLPTASSTVLGGIKSSEVSTTDYIQGYNVMDSQGVLKPYWDGKFLNASSSMATSYMLCLGKESGKAQVFTSGLYCNRGTLYDKDGIAFPRVNVENTWTAYQDFTAGAGNSGSDIRFKSVQKDTIGNVINDIQDIKIFPYIWTKQGETNWDTFGVDANQLIQKGGIYSKMVHERKDEYKTKFVDYDRFGLIAIKAIQELTEKIQNLENTINELKNK